MKKLVWAFTFFVAATAASASAASYRLIKYDDPVFARSTRKRRFRTGYKRHAKRSSRLLPASGLRAATMLSPIGAG